MNVNDMLFYMSRIINFVEGNKYGIEIELEGSKIVSQSYDTAVTKTWTLKDDNSLRNSPQRAEYVSSFPIDFKHIGDHLLELSEYLESNNALIKNSHRCSVHVHRNVMDVDVFELYKIITIYYILEEVVLNLYGNTRKGNRFCLRLKDAIMTPNNIRAGFIGFQFSRDRRYSSLNLSSINQIGTIEFRGFDSVTNVRDVFNYISTIENIFEAAKVFDDFQDIINKASINPKEFIIEILGEEFYNEESEKQIYEAIPLVYSLIEGWEALNYEAHYIMGIVNNRRGNSEAVSTTEPRLTSELWAAIPTQFRG